jgi:integrase
MRARREGTVYQRKDGRWVAALWTEEDGTLKRRHYYAATQSEAIDRLGEKRGDAQKGLPLPNERQTLGPLLDEWIEGVEVRPQTKATYAWVVNRHLKPGLGSVRLTALSARRIERFLAAKRAAGLAAGTVRHVRVVLVMALAYATRHNLVGRNEASLARGPKRSDYEANPLDRDETRKLIEALRGDRFEALFTTLAVLGLRLGEALALRWRDVVLDEHPFLMVRHSLVRLKGEKPTLAPTKTSRRKLNLPAGLADILRRYRVKQIEERLLVGPGWKADDFVFTTGVGTPVDHANAYKAFQRVLQRAGLRRVRLHDLRHGAASALLLDGVDLKRISAALGHSKIATTADTYVHVLEALDEQAARRLDALFLTSAERSEEAPEEPAAVNAAVN